MSKKHKRKKNNISRTENTVDVAFKGARVALLVFID